MEARNLVVDLRQQLASRFPHLRQHLRASRTPASLPTGIPQLDSLLGGGLPRGELTELVARGLGSGSTEVIHELVRHRAVHRQFLALVDGMGSFDPGAADPRALSRLLWIRCRHTRDALQAADLLLRDRNFSLVVLDLKLNPLPELRNISASVWYRYARLLEQNQTTLMVVTPQQLVSGASSRFSVESAFGIEALGRSRAELVSGLRFQPMHSAAMEVRRQEVA